MSHTSRTSRRSYAEAASPKSSKTMSLPLVEHDGNATVARSNAVSQSSARSSAAGAGNKDTGMRLSQPLVEHDRNATARSNAVSQPSARSSAAGAGNRETAPRTNQVTQMSSKSSTANGSGKEKENVTTRTARERRPSEKVVAALTEKEEAARHQAVLEANRAERAKRSQRRKDKANGVDRPAQSDDEERPDGTFTSQPVVTKANAQKAALVQRKSKVPPPAPAWVQRSEPLASRVVPAERNTAPQQIVSRRDSPSPALQRFSSRYRSRSLSRSRSRSHSRHRARRTPTRSPSVEDFDMHAPGESRSRSRSLSPAASVNANGKRARSPEDDAIDEITATFVKAQKVTEGSGRPKASDYDEVAKQVILTATGIYRCLISTVNAFPTPSEEATLIREAWDRANVETAQEVPIGLSPLIAKVISARGSQIRSEVKGRAVTYVETLYGFESGRGKSIIKENRQLAEQLKLNHSGFLYKNPAKESGLYQHPIIQKIVNKSWFNNPRDEGILYVDLFDPLSVEAISLVLTAIECAIDGWGTGLKTELSFYGSEYKSIYLRHVKTLQAFGVATSKHDLLGKLQRSLFNFGRVHAGVSSSVSQSSGLMLSDAAFAAALKEYEEDTETEDEGEEVD